MTQQFISIIIPTRNRPELVIRAINSVFRQTVSNVEAVVVVDGPDKITGDALKAISDIRLRVIHLTQSVGGAEARNVGVQEARGEWVAFLDDDDEWFPEKLERQLALADSLSVPFPVVSCRFIARGESSEEVWPKKLPRPEEIPANYLFVRKGPFLDAAQFQTSTLLTKRELMNKVPFHRLPRHQDWDWLIRASAVPGFKLSYCPEPLTIWHRDENRHRISNNITKTDWQFSLKWVTQYKEQIGPRAFADFILTAPASIAQRTGDCSAFFYLLRKAVREGKPTLWALIVFLGIWLFPKKLRQQIRQVAQRNYKTL